MDESDIYLDIFDIPKEIYKFFVDVFELYEIRVRVGIIGNISFIIHTNESNHNVPHLHAKYNEYEVSIEIPSGKILAGNLPFKQQNKAQGWVKINADDLLTKWRDITLAKELPLHRSGLQ